MKKQYIIPNVRVIMLPPVVMQQQSINSDGDIKPDFSNEEVENNTENYEEL